MKSKRKVGIKRRVEENGRKGGRNGGRMGWRKLKEGRPYVGRKESR